MLKLGCTPPNLSNICLHKSTKKFYPIVEADEELHDIIREVMAGAPSRGKFIEMKTLPPLNINIFRYIIRALVKLLN